MAGNRHHYIPRFLQKGFSSKKRKKEVYTFVFTKDKKPYEPNLINVGLETDFYGNPHESTADDKITTEEDKYVGFIEKLRTINSTQSVDPTLSAAIPGAT